MPKKFRKTFSLFVAARALPLDFRAAEKASEIIYRPRKVGISVNDFDILIAGICEAYGMEEIITKDKDFKFTEKISNIKVTLI